MTTQFIVETLYTGDGTTVLFPFTFEYIDEADVRVSLDEVDTTEWSLDNATTVRMNTAPAVGVAIRVYRDTSINATKAVFYPGSAIRAQDLNDNFEQTLFAVQESVDDTAEATAAAEAATAAAVTATDTANDALTTAESAQDDATLALSQSDQALEQSSTALATSETADANATAALNAVGTAVQYTLVPNVGAIPSSPANGDAIEVVDSTGIESFTPLSGLPDGFVGDSGMSVRMQYDSVVPTWVFLLASPQDPDSRYVEVIGDTLTGPLILAGAPAAELEATTKGYVDSSVSTVSSQAAAAQADATQAQADATQALADAAAATATADAALPKAGGTMTGQIAFTPAAIADGVAWDASANSSWTFAGGVIANPTNQAVGQQGIIYVTGAVTGYGDNFTAVASASTTPYVVPYYVAAVGEVKVGAPVEV